MEYIYEPKGVCSYKMIFNINKDNILEDFKVEDGCNGNLKGIRALILNQNINDIIEKLDGIKCGVRDTSCPDQIAKALKEYLNK